METVRNSCHSGKSTVDAIDFKVQQELDIITTKLEKQHLIDNEYCSEDQGICLSYSSSPAELSASEDLSSEDEEKFSFEDKEESLASILAEMALDLRKKVNKKQNEDGGSSEFSDDDNTAVALDLTSSSTRQSTAVPIGSPPPLTPLHPSTNAVKSLSQHEKTLLRQAYKNLIRFLKLDPPLRPQENRKMAIERLQSFLFMYLIEVKRKSPAGIQMFHNSFGSDAAITQFFTVFLGKSEQLIRTSSLPSNFGRPAGSEEGAVSLLCRGPVDRPHNRVGAMSNPYPPRRMDSGHHPYAGGFHSYRGAHLSSHQPAHAMNDHSSRYQQNFPTYQFQHQLAPPQQNHPLPKSPSDTSVLPSTPEQIEVSDEFIENVMHHVCNLFPLSNEVKGLQTTDFEELYGPEQLLYPSSPSVVEENLASPLPPNPHRIVQHVSHSMPDSPASPWQTATFVANSPLYNPSTSNSPYSNVRSPSLSSASSSPAPGSPLPRSMENQMTRMTLVPPQQTNQPPPLIRMPPAQPLIAPKHPTQPSSGAQPRLQPVTNTYQTAHDELLAIMDHSAKEESMRKVVKSPMEILTDADRDGDTPLMVACANPLYKNEDLYVIIERLKSHPQPAKVFCAMNNRRETALFLAATERRPLVAGYLAETMSALRIPLNQTFEKGNTLIHYLAMSGDEYSEVLRYLIRVRTPMGKLAFDLNARNHTGRSALHEIVMQYHADDPVGEGFVKNIQLLLEYGADAGLSDITSGKTPIHIAIEKRDPFLLDLLLSKCPGSANTPMYNDNRPLHSAATLTGVTENQQLELVNILLKYGADKALRNKANKLPIELVQQDRDRVKAVLQARSRTNYVA